MAKTKVKALAFDLGSVLVDVDFTPMFEKMLPHSEFQSITELRLNAPIHERHFISGPARDFYTGRIGPEDYYKIFCLEAGVNMASFSYDDFVHAFNNVFVEIKEMTNLLNRVRRQVKMMIMITNINQLHYDFLKAEMPHLFEPFDHVIESHLVGCMKPDKRIYSISLDYLKMNKISRGEMMFIDDVKENIFGAKRMKIKTFWFDRTRHFPELLKELKCKLKAHGMEV